MRKFTLLYLAVTPPFLLALHFLNRRTYASLHIGTTGPRTVFRLSQITCLGQSFSGRDTEVLRLRKCIAKRNGSLRAM